MIKAGIKVTTRSYDLTKKEQEMFEWLEKELPYEKHGSWASEAFYRIWMFCIVKGRLKDSTSWKVKRRVPMYS